MWNVYMVKTIIIELVFLLHCNVLSYFCIIVLQLIYYNIIHGIACNPANIFLLLYLCQELYLIELYGIKLLSK